MKKTVLAFAIFSVCMIQLVSAQNKSEIKKLQGQISNTFITRPDSAKVYLLELLRYSDQLSDSLLARNYNKLGVSYGQLEQADSSRLYFKKGIETARNSRMKGNLYVNMGVSERNMANYDRAFEALKQAKTHYSTANFQEGMGLVYLEIATIYNYQSEEGKAIEELKKAIRIFDSIGKPQRSIVAKQELANAYNHTGKYVFAKDLYEAVLPKLKESGQLNYHFALFGYARCLVNLGEIDKAKETYQTIIDYFDTTNNLKFYSFAMYKTAQVYEKSEDFETAAQNYETAFQGMLKMRSARLKQVGTDYLALLTTMGKHKKALEILRKIQGLKAQDQFSMNDRGEVLFLQEAAEVLKQNQLYQEAYFQLEQATFLQDSIRKERNEIQIEEIQEKYQNEYQRKENKLLEEKNQLLAEKNRAKRNVIILIALLAVLIVIVSVIIYRKQKQQTKLKATALKNMERSKKNLEEKLVVEATLHKERQEALEEKERELVGSSIKIAHLKNRVTSILENSSGSTNGTKTRLKALLGKENTWSYFMTKFVKVHPGFVEKVQNDHSQLSKNDLDFSALILLRLSNKEIATLLNISHESVITKKYRLRKKMNFSTKENSLEEYLDGFK